MTAPRFFLREALSDGGDPLGAPGWRCGDVVEVPLSAADLHHAADVLRLSSGEVLTVAEPSGIVWRLQAAEVSRSRLTGQVLGCDPELAGATVTLVQGVPKGTKMDRIVEQAVEVGATAVMPVFTERSVVRLELSKRVERGERWRRVAEAAAKQARRRFVPRIYDPVPLDMATSVLASHDVVLVVWEEAGGERGIPRALAESGAGPGSSIALVVGPEGGLSAQEIETLRALGAQACTMGETILRTETAGLVALVLTLSALGDLGAHA